MKEIQHERGFKVIQCSLVEIARLGCNMPMCDRCNNATFDGYYIAVLNRWFCPSCYEEYISRATWYPEDSAIEDRNYEDAKLRMSV